jgi:hypothetical protein
VRSLGQRKLRNLQICWIIVEVITT